MKIKFVLLTLLLCFSLWSFSQSSLHGKVTASDTGEELIGANIIVLKDDAIVAGTSTDFKGNYSMLLDSGTYKVNVSYLGYPDNSIQGVVIKPDQENLLNVEMAEPIGCVIIGCGTRIIDPPLIQIDNTTSSSIIKSNEIQNSPFRDTKDLIINTVGARPASY